MTFRRILVITHPCPIHPQIAISWGQHGAHLGPVGPRWAPCLPHEPCYQGLHLVQEDPTMLHILRQLLLYKTGKQLCISCVITVSLSCVAFWVKWCLVYVNSMIIVAICLRRDCPPVTVAPSHFLVMTLRHQNAFHASGRLWEEYIGDRWIPFTKGH